MGPSLGSKLASLEAGVGEGGVETVRELSNLGGTGGGLVPLRKGKVGSHVSIFGNGVGFARQFYRMANTDRKGYLRRSYSAKEPYGQWPLCGK